MAVPSSGAISLAGIRAELATNTYNASATTTASLEDCSDGTVATINTENDSDDRPDASISYWTVLKDGWKKENPDRPVFEGQ